jgi:hypothetical protein
MFAKSCQEGTINDARSPMGLLQKRRHRGRNAFLRPDARGEALAET